VFDIGMILRVIVCKGLWNQSLPIGGQHVKRKHVPVNHVAYGDMQQEIKDAGKVIALHHFA